MNKKFVFSMWTYNDINEFTPDELDVWVDLGMTLPMLPATRIGRDDPSILKPWLDKAEKLGVQVIVNYTGMSYGDYANLGREKYIERVKPLYDALASHPAVHGFCIGDEPFNKEALEAALGTLKVNKELAPHLTPYLNYTGATEDFPPELLGGRDLCGWMKHAYEESGVDEICFDSYSQTINTGGGMTGHITALKKWKDAAKAANDSELWGCLLSSGHHVYSPPDENMYRWQINTAAAAGLRGVLWFRLYDRANVISYYGSPIDEFGDKSEAYYALKRCQRRFNNHFGEIFMKLKHKSTYMINSDRGVFPTFTEGSHDIITKIRANDETMISFFEDENGDEFLCIVHCETRFYGDVYVHFDKSKYYLSEYTMNGAHQSRPDGAEADCEINDAFVEFTPIPAALHLFKIVKK